jgi:replicative DNA helicase
MAIQVWMQKNTLETPPDDFTKGYNVVYVSLEMSKEDCFQRTMCRLADVRSYDLRDAKLSKAEREAVGKVGSFIKKYPYTFEVVDVPRGLTVERLENILEEIRNEYKPDIIFVDYLTLMDDDSVDEDWLKLDKLAGKMHEFTRVYNIPIVTALQLTRINPADKKADEKRIGLHRIGRSSQMAHHCTLIIQIESRENEESRFDFIYHIIKNRHGESNKSHTVYKDFSKLQIIDKPYNPDFNPEWTEQENLLRKSENILDIYKDFGF